MGKEQVKISANSAFAERQFVRRFTLWYQMGAILFVLIVSLSLGVAYRYSVLHTMEKLTENNNITAGKLLSNHLYENHQGELPAIEQSGLSSATLNFDRLDSHIQQVIPSINVVLVKIFNIQGQTVYTSSPIELSNIEESDTALKTALLGKYTTEITGPDPKKSPQSPLANKYYAETYFPLYSSHESTQIIGVLELYLDVTEQFENLRRSLILFGFIVIGIVLFLLVWGRLLIAPAERLMRIQHARQQKMRAVIERAPIGIILANGVQDNHTISYANDAAGILLQENPRALIGLSMDEIAGKSASPVQYRYSSQAGESFSTVTQLQHRSKSGKSSRWLELISGSSTYTDSSDDPKPFQIVVVSDIDDRKNLEMRKTLLSHVVEKSSNAIEILDKHGRFEYLNHAAEGLHGVRMRDLVGHTPAAVGRLGKMQSDLYTAVNNTLMTGMNFEGQLQTTHVSGNILTLSSSIYAIKDAAEAVSKTVVIQRDISAQVLARTESQKLSLAVEQSTSMIMITDVNGIIEYINPSFVADTGFQSHEVIGKNPRILQSGDTPIAHYEHMWSTIKNGQTWQGEVRNKTRDGVEYWGYQKISALRNDAGKITHFVAVIENITAQKETNARLNFLAMHDDLTRLHNRTAFNQRLEYFLSMPNSRRPISAALVINIDNFKDINSGRGQYFGDMVLVEVGQRLLAVCHNQDIVARLNGDEFGLVATHISSHNGAGDIANAIIDAIAKPLTLDDVTINISVSIGIAMLSQDGNDFDTVIRHAELALKSNQERRGGEYYFFQTAMDEEVARYRSLVSDIKTALANHEFELHYQPVVHQPTGVIRSTEALLRWHHKERGWVSPVEIIPIAEHTGLIVPIGRWVIREACQQIKRWQSEGLDIVVAVNLSSIQFQSGNLHNEIEEIIIESGIEPSMLQVEITESVALGAPETVLPTLGHFRKLGMKILLDDFGTGYSSLSQLRNLPIDRLKIDRSFLDDIQEGFVDDRVIKSIIELGKSLHMAVTVEGVETKFQRDVLVALGCVDFQGYYYFKPMPASEISTILRERGLEAKDSSQSPVVDL